MTAPLSKAPSCSPRPVTDGMAAFSNPEPIDEQSTAPECCLVSSRARNTGNHAEIEHFTRDGHRVGSPAPNARQRRFGVTFGVRVPDLPPLARTTRRLTSLAARCPRKDVDRGPVQGNRTMTEKPRNARRTAEVCRDASRATASLASKSELAQALSRPGRWPDGRRRPGPSGSRSPAPRSRPGRPPRSPPFAPRSRRQERPGGCGRW